MALVEDGVLLGSKQVNMGNSGLHKSPEAGKRKRLKSEEVQLGN